MKYKRILLKLSGEALQGSSKSTNIDPAVLAQYCEEIKQVKDAGVQLSIVIGGGNIFRGGQAEALGIDRVQGDYMGMLATGINAMSLCKVRLNGTACTPASCQGLRWNRSVNHLSGVGQ